MQLQITRISSDECTYSILTSSGKQYTVRDSELERWLLNLGVEPSLVGAVLNVEPNQTATLHSEKAA
jgi:hypothetical protein